MCDACWWFLYFWQPTEADPAPQVYRMRLFVTNPTAAKSRFWYFLHKVDKLKRSTGEVLSIREIRERKTTTVKNYGITIKYNSRSGTHNMYKEYRDVSLCGAVAQMYQELAGRHRARFSSIQIVDARTVPTGTRQLARYNPETDGPVPPPAIKRTTVKQFAKSNIKFPLPHRIQRPTDKAHRATFVASRPTTFFR